MIKDSHRIVYYCGPGRISNPIKWHPTSRSIGGSEEAIVNITRQLKLDHPELNIIVYCNLEHESNESNESNENPLGLEHENVLYKPYYLWNPLEYAKCTIIWRDPTIIGNIEKINTDSLVVDLHDAIYEDYSEYSRFKYILVKSEYQKNSLVPSIYHSKTIVIPNGLVMEYSPEEFKKDPYMILSTSSPDRCLNGLLKMLPIITKLNKNYKIYWAYGFKKQEQEESFLEALSKNPYRGSFVYLGKKTLSEIEEYYQKAKYFIYGTHFPEIDCVSLTKALYYHCEPLVYGGAALKEKLPMDTKNYNNKNVIRVFMEDYSITDGPDFREWLLLIMDKLRNNNGSGFNKKYLIGLERFDIKNVANHFYKVINN
jgi:hypothetical protein